MDTKLSNTKAAKARRSGRRVITKLQRVKDYLLIHPHATNDELRLEFGCSQPVCTQARRELVAEGLIPRSVWNRRALGEAMPDPALLTAEGAEQLKEALAKLEGDDGSVHTAEEMRKRVSSIARQAAASNNPQLEMAALSQLAKLEAQLGAENRLGPGLPLTKEDKINRLTVLLDVCGPEITALSSGSAFNLDQLETLIDHLTVERTNIVVAQESK